MKTRPNAVNTDEIADGAVKTSAGIGDPPAPARLVTASPSNDGSKSWSGPSTTTGRRSTLRSTCSSRAETEVIA